MGRVGETEQFRALRRGNVRTYPNVIAIRVDESLYFANAKYIAEVIRSAVANQPTVKHVVLVCSAINFIDASALETLDHLILELNDAGVILHLAAVKGPVMERLNRVNFAARLGEGQIFLSTHEAMQVLSRT